MATLTVALAVPEAEAAKRLGGARSTGVQRNVTAPPPAAVPGKPAQPTQQAAPAQQAQPAGAQPAAAAAQPSGLSRWMPMLGGLALGGLLGALFAGNGMGGLLLVALLAIGAFLVFRMLAARRAQNAPQQVQYAGMNERVTLPPQEPVSSGAAAPVRQGSIPAGFDEAGFLRAARMNFAKLQVANDAGNLGEIREFTTPEMFEAIKADIESRGGQAQQVDVYGLQADLLEVTTEGGQHWASVRFTGAVREAPGAAPEDFSEVWNLVKPADGSAGWMLAGIQQMH